MQQPTTLPHNDFMLQNILPAASTHCSWRILNQTVWGWGFMYHSRFSWISRIYFWHWGNPRLGKSATRGTENQHICSTKKSYQNIFLKILKAPQENAWVDKSRPKISRLYRKLYVCRIFLKIGHDRKNFLSSPFFSVLPKKTSAEKIFAVVPDFQKNPANI